MLFQRSKNLLLLFFTALTGTLFAQNYNIALRSEVTFPTETVANVCGFAKDGYEYALVGGSQNTHIVDVTNPDMPVIVASIPFSNSLWKEIRVYQHYAYITTEGNGAGVQIIDLSPLPASTTLPHKIYKGDGAVSNTIQTVHSLQIDETKGFLYLYGSNIGVGGAIVCDLNTDPYNPVYVGQYNETYIHDGYADNDTLYGSHISDGYFTVIDFTDKNNPITLATQPTPNTFTHNTWLTDDRKHLLTTDETADSYLTMYDISDLNNIRELDRLQCTPGSGSVVHNTYIRGNFAITAWYTDGVNIVDITEPDNMVQVGWYDTYDGSGAGFEGAWGVYPYLPSGNLIVSNITPGKIYILTPTYVRAAYLAGLVTDAVSGAPIVGAKVEFVNGDGIANNGSTSDLVGNYRAGVSTPGAITVRYSKAGYIPQDILVNLTTGATTTQNVALVSNPTFVVSGVVRDQAGSPITGATVLYSNTDFEYTATTAANGTYSLSGVYGGDYQVLAGKWGYNTIGQTASITGATQNELTLSVGYSDPFAMDLGWTISGTSQQGQFELVEPNGSEISGFVLTPDEDTDDFGDKCFITGNNGTNPIDDDLLLGTAVIQSPVMDLSGYTGAQMSFSTFFFNAGQTSFGTDSIKVFVSNGTLEKVAYFRTFDNAGWQPATVDVDALLPLTANMRVRVVARERNYGAQFIVTEAGFDNFQILETSAASEPVVDMGVTAQPNPFHSMFTLKWAPTPAEATVIITNQLGQVVDNQVVAPQQNTITLRPSVPAGIYFAQIRTAEGVSRAVRLVKQ
jgi:choice-of-anchor B domain-containing protein